MIVWISFIVLIVIFLALDLGVFNKNPHEITNKEASVWTAIWVSTALLFSLVVFFIFKHDWVDNVDNLTPTSALMKYITGYLIELSLSVDNIFVIAVIFTSFKIPKIYQHRVLFWGIIGAIVFRALMILFGVFLIKKFDWIIYVFGVFLIYTAIKLAIEKEDDAYDPRNSFVYKTIRKIIPVTTHMNSEHFFIRKKHLLVATPLFIALIIIEFTDILFALDSIPAILAITSDPFLVFSSNIMAILGLRSMYFFLANMLERFGYLKYSLVVILSFVGVKMILSHHVEIPEWLSLTVIGASLGAGIWFSLHKEKKEKI
ncbi:TerC family protein [Galbibacter orientalis]|uniref:Integral membrane protein, TerC family n=1 Tax=Galbibacter orientalis DSM 19592 TaxID=926559 RepID=I3C9S5_9FLAO|nr:TerC family protein [Galbibacter orientalis]EIJ40368.1 integral membrane protein, TerC family [Galbibacter orientalis DSM 19592]